MRRVVPVVPARPGVDVKSSAWRNNHVAGVTNTVRKHRCTKTGGQSQSAAIVRARLALGFCSGIGWLVSRAQRTNHARCGERDEGKQEDRKSTRLNSSHGYISYAVFCLKKKKNPQIYQHSLPPSSDSPHRDTL